MSHVHIDAQHAMDFSTINQVIRHELGDSIAGLILSSDSIVGNLTVWEDDTLPDKSLSACMRNLVKYTLCKPSMYKSDKRIYASFYADVRLEIISQTESLVLELDYSTYKWRLLDGGKQIYRHDLPDQAMLPLVHMIWPESKLINIKYNKYILPDGK